MSTELFPVAVRVAADMVPRWVYVRGMWLVLGTDRHMTPNHRCDVYRKRAPGDVGLRIPALVLLGELIAEKRIRGCRYLLCSVKATLRP